MKIIIVLSSIFFLAVSQVCAQSGHSRFALGINYIGGQVRYELNSSWAGELRYLTGSESASTGDVTSQVFGLRGYRFFKENPRRRFFLGAEAAMISSDQENTSYEVSGPAVGAFGGLEYRIGENFSLGFDIGPYFFSLKEKKTDVSDTSLEFVANTFFTFYIF
ncbi:hypothetical protein ACFL6Y_02990 [Elusimicrobiota bacterium]